MGVSFLRRLLDPRGHFFALRELLGLLTTHRQLTWEMSIREMRDRYVGQWFGAFWAFGHPLILILVYVYVFSYVFKLKVTTANEDFTVYLLSGLIPWLSFAEVMSKSGLVIQNHSNLVKQVVFPIEVLPVKGVLTSVFTQVVMTVFFVLYALIRYDFYLPLTYLYLPLIILLQTLAMIGVAYMLSAIGAYFKDIKDFVQVFAVIGIFVMPLFYQEAQVPENVRWILHINPFSHMMWVYRDACFTGRIDHPNSWWLYTLGSLALFDLGYRLFRKLRVMFGDVL